MKKVSVIDFVLDNLLIILFLGIAIAYSSREVSDLDLWLHLKTGQHIIQSHSIPISDIFSFTVSGKPWIDHEWLFQVVTYFFYSAFGSSGLILMQNLVIAATFLTFFITSIRKNNHITVFLVLYLTLLACVYRFMIRPDIFSFLFIAIYLCSLRAFIEKGSRLIWLLPLFQIAWINIHGLSFTGPLAVLMVILGELTKRYVKLPWSWNQIYRIDDKKMKQLYVLLGALLLASFINPYGIKGVIYPFNVIGQVSGKGNVIFQYVMELARPFNRSNIFNLSHLIFYKLLIVASVLSFVFNRRRINIFDLALWGFFFAASLAARRNISYFALISGFVILNNIAIWNEGRVATQKSTNRSAWLIALRYLCIFLIFFYTIKEARMFMRLVAGSRGTYALRSSPDGLAQARYPQKAVEFLSKHKFPRYIFNDFNSGSYLIGNASPERKVFIDGRTELYGPEFFMDYIAAGQGDKQTIEKLIRKYDIKGFFLTISANDLQDGLLHTLLYSPKWKLVYLDESAAIFLWDVPENSALIEKFRIDLKKWSPPPPDALSTGGSGTFYYPYANIYRARFLHRHGFHEAAAKEAVAILGFMPNDAEAQYFVSECYPENAGKYAQRGNDYLNAGNADEAIDDYNKAIELSPNTPDAYNNRAVAYFEKHEYNKSWEDVHKAESMGFKVHPDFIKQLKLLSGNEK